MIELDIRKTLHASREGFALDVRLRVEDGEFLALFGESGAGKTTLLRCIGGLTEPDEGYIRVNGDTWFDSRKKVNLPPQHRRVGLVFQHYALFPNMTVRGNLEFSLRPGARRHLADEVIEMMALGELQQRRPAELSGGQQQRVALARALVSEPRFLLLDEPFSALDQQTRLRLQDEVLRVQRLLGLTTVMVSHEVSEVYKLARRVLVMEGGRVVREGTPEHVFGAGHAGGRFSFAAEVLAIQASDVVFTVTLLVGNQVMRVIATASEARGLHVGDRVTLLSKAFNPAIVPVG